MAPGHFHSSINHILRCYYYCYWYIIILIQNVAISDIIAKQVQHGQSVNH